MHLLSILPDLWTGNAACCNQCSVCIFWLVTEGVLHETKLLLNSPSDFGSPSQQVLLLPTWINSAIVIHHITLFTGDTTIFALAVSWSTNSILSSGSILHVKLEQKKNSFIPNEKLSPSLHHIIFPIRWCCCHISLVNTTVLKPFFLHNEINL
jgi:hypothetical protein